MSEITVGVTSGGWTVEYDDITLEASHPVHDRGVVRCVVAAHRGGELLYRYHANLTGARARGRFLRELAAHGAELPEDVLLALDEAIRRTPRPVPLDAEKNACDGSLGFSGTVPSLAALTRIVRRWLLLTDRDLLPVALGAAAAHRRCQDTSPWLLLVAPSSGTKTEIVRMAEAMPRVYPLSKLTARTLASGLDKDGSDPSLLARLTDEILLVKDLTTVLELRPDERQVIFAQLREIYDGRYDESWGTGKELHWQGRLGFLAGVTPVIDQHHHAMAILGPRFLLFRTVSPDREEAAAQAMLNSGREHEMRAELAGAAAAFLATLDGRPLPELDVGGIRWLARVATFVTRARSPVQRDGYRRELDYAPEPEMPMRFAKQLQNLVCGIALVSGRACVTPKDLRRVARVAPDCLPALRRNVLLKLAELDGHPSTGEVAEAAQLATGTVRRTLEDLQALKLVTRFKATKQGQPDRWAITPKTRAALAVLRNPDGTVPEKPRTRHTHKMKAPSWRARRRQHTPPRRSGRRTAGGAGGSSSAATARPAARAAGSSAHVARAKRAARARRIGGKTA